MLPPVALGLAVLIFLLSVGTIIWLYVRHFWTTAVVGHRGSYSPSFVQEKVLGKTAESRKDTCAAFKEFPLLPVHVDEADSGVQLLTSTPLKDELLPLEPPVQSKFDSSCPSDIKLTIGLSPETETCDVEYCSVSQHASPSASDSEDQSDSSDSSAEYILGDETPCTGSTRGLVNSITVPHCNSVAMSCDVIKEDEMFEGEMPGEAHITGTFRRNSHDETYRQYMESVLLKKRAEMFFGTSGAKFRKSCFETT
uniref:Putative secreted protein n=1 Tax=Ixodes ricinus TaxID=34613 RepID=V5HJ01_IXORI